MSCKKTVKISLICISTVMKSYPFPLLYSNVHIAQVLYLEVCGWIAKYWKKIYSVFGDLAGKSSMPRPLQHSTILIWCQVVSYWTSDQTFHHIQSIFERKLQHENTLVHKLCLTIQSTPFNFVKEMYIAF